MKVLYIESKGFCEQTLNRLMLPAIIISAASSVISLGLKNYEYGSLIVAALAAFDSCLLAIISYLKLDAKAEAHKTSSYRFDKLQTKCEFYSGKVLLLDTAKPKEKLTEEVSEMNRQLKLTRNYTNSNFEEEVLLAIVCSFICNWNSFRLS